MLCVGVGGSGRHSLTRLASSLHREEQMAVFQIEPTKGFGLKQFREFLKDLYENAGSGKRNQNSVFLFSDNDVV
jgi:dynein heavy chain, axonemal